MQLRPCNSMAQQQDPSHFRAPSGEDARSAWHCMHSVSTRSYAPWERSWQEFKSDTERGESPSSLTRKTWRFLTHPADLITILIAVLTFQKATSAHINPHKYKALAVGNWAEPPTKLGIDFCHQVTILGVHFGSTIEASTKGSWASVNAAVPAQARKAYDRSLCLAQRIQYV